MFPRAKHDSWPRCSRQPGGWVCDKCQESTWIYPYFLFWSNSCFICLKAVKGTCLTVILSCQKKPRQYALTDIFIALLYVISLKFQAWSDRNRWRFIQSWTTVSLSLERRLTWFCPSSITWQVETTGQGGQRLFLTVQTCEQTGIYDKATFYGWICACQLDWRLLNVWGGIVCAATFGAGIRLNWSMHLQPQLCEQFLWA